MAVYSRVSYWNQRYLKANGEVEETSEWYCNYNAVRELLFSFLYTPKGTTESRRTVKLLTPSLSVDSSSYNTKMSHASCFPQKHDCRVLMLGCGNSSMGRDMQNDGFLGHTVYLDFSEVVVSQMKQKYIEETTGNERNNSKVEFICADITKGLPFADETFDLVICKGTLDAVLCNPASKVCGSRLVSESARVLTKDHGVLFLVTHGNPDSRIELLECKGDIRYYWRIVEVHPFAGDEASRDFRNQDKKPFFVYLCQKGRDVETKLGKENNNQAPEMLVTS